MTMLRCTAAPGLLSGQFRTGNLHLREGSWTELDADDPKVRADLLAYVPRHVRVAMGQDRELEAAGLKFKDAALVDLRAEKAKSEAAAKAAADKEKAPPSAKK